MWASGLRTYKNITIYYKILPQRRKYYFEFQYTLNSFCDGVYIKNEKEFQYFFLALGTNNFYFMSIALQCDNPLLICGQKSRWLIECNISIQKYNNIIYKREAC